ncbi:RSP_7527 family protein [Jannaschia rubra]|uniref:Uncharacterized protein n=1 Tax=Jannaschia rubra TaxID=282197 RepID=A0A0M6XND9_9RHOB|nr:hypothetical protein [Jannaschia rubra]CTQ32097.1 hypothetical protein JAN5088_00859 [Jannaschia rubra]SFG37677.1 hypothetical protein SAMN04488517_104135 [Jannaschia rubra]
MTQTTDLDLVNLELKARAMRAAYLRGLVSAMFARLRSGKPAHAAA